jgi:hypothetical protein
VEDKFIVWNNLDLIWFYHATRNFIFVFGYVIIVELLQFQVCNQCYSSSIDEFSSGINIELVIQKSKPDQ